MAEATLFKGNPEMVAYTPSSGNISAGQVVLVGNTAGWTCGVAHADITNSTLGSLAAGGGIYAVTNLNNSADGAKVYWDDSVNKVTSVSTNMSLFGFIVEGGGGGANSTCYALHKPYV